METVQCHLTRRLVKAKNTFIGDDQPGPTVGEFQRGPFPSTTQVSRAGEKIKRLNKGPPLEPHNHKYLLGVDGDLARAAAARQADLGPPPIADDGGVQVAKAVDLGAAQKGDLHAPALQVQTKKVSHRADRRRAADEGRVANGKGQASGPRAIDAALIDQFQMRGYRPPGQVAGAIGQPHADKHGAHARQRPRC